MTGFNSFAEFAAVLQNEAMRESVGAKVKVVCGTSGMCDIGLYLCNHRLSFINT